MCQFRLHSAGCNPRGGLGARQNGAGVRLLRSLCNQSSQTLPICCANVRRGAEMALHCLHVRAPSAAAPKAAGARGLSASKQPPGACALQISQSLPVLLRCCVGWCRGDVLTRCSRTAVSACAGAATAAVPKEAGARRLSAGVQSSGACASRSVRVCRCCCAVVWAGAEAMCSRVAHALL